MNSQDIERNQNERPQAVQDYLDWINRTDAELRGVDREECLRLKPVNRKMADQPTW